MAHVMLDINAMYNAADPEGESVKEVKDDFAKKNMDINVRQIKNGWLVRRSWNEPADDENGRPYDKYESEEEYYAENPL